jgi:transcriptional regulator with XRE-family HTH domain
MENIMGKRIHQKRIEKNMTMESLANHLGVGKSAVNKWEKGHITNIKRDTIDKMARLFDCSPAWLMGYSEELPEPDLAVYDADMQYVIERFQRADDRTKLIIKEILDLK